MTETNEHVDRRLRAFRNRLQQKSIDLAIVWEPDNQYYLTGFRAITYFRTIILWVYDDRTEYIIPTLEAIHAKTQAKVDQLHVYHEQVQHRHSDTDHDQIFLRLLDQIPKHWVIGLELSVIPASVYQMIVDRGYQVVDVTRDFIELRAVKDEEEIHWLRAAGVLSDIALQASFANVREGMSELEFDSYGDRKLLEVASEKYPDHIVGEPTEKQRELFDLAVEAQKTGLDMIRPGVRAKDVDIASFQVFDKAGYGEYVKHRIGHGIGLSEHEEPYLRFDNDLVLKESMVYTIEPGFYVPSVGGFRHSDTVILTENGYKCMTNYPHDVEDLIIY